MARDYYEILGVARDADKEEIKRAYRRSARKYHPDVNKEAGAEERFKEINRAYEVLSEPELRARYDRFGEAGVASGAGAAGYQDFGDLGGFADIFESFFSGFSGGPSGQGRRRDGPLRGDDLRLDLRLEFREAVFGGEKEIRINHMENCGTCRGSGAKPGTQPRVCSTCSGSGQVRRATRTPFGSFTQVSVCPMCNGSGQVIEDRCEVCGGRGQKQETKKLKITIPAGVDNGTRLRISGEGDAGQRGGPPGDLYVYLFVNDDPEFRRDGTNVLSEIEVSYLQAIFGVSSVREHCGWSRRDDHSTRYPTQHDSDLGRSWSAPIRQSGEPGRSSAHHLGGNSHTDYTGRTRTPGKTSKDTGRSHG